MSDRERAKEWLDEMSSNDIDRILYFMNLSLTKRGLYYEKCELKKEIERLNNIINELEKYIKKEFYIIGNSPKGSFYEGYDTCLEEMKQEILNKLNELKGDNK